MIGNLQGFFVGRKGVIFVLVEYDLKRYLGVPEDTSFVQKCDGSVSVMVRDGSFDYTEKGKEFLSGDVFRVSNAGLTPCRVYPE